MGMSSSGDVDVLDGAARKDAAGRTETCFPDGGGEQRHVQDEIDGCISRKKETDI